MGSRFLKYQENFILESFAAHLEGSEKILSAETNSKMIYDFRKLKCSCTGNE